MKKNALQSVNISYNKRPTIFFLFFSLENDFKILFLLIFSFHIFIMTEHVLQKFTFFGVRSSQRSATVTLMLGITTTDQQNFTWNLKFYMH